MNPQNLQKPNQPVPCYRCKVNKGTERFTESPDFVHGVFRWTCPKCVLEVQVAFAKERAAELPKLEAALADCNPELITEGEREAWYAANPLDRYLGERVALQWPGDHSGPRNLSTATIVDHDHDLRVLMERLQSNGLSDQVVIYSL